MFDQMEFVKNLSQFTPEQLAPYEGHHVAWSTDGKRILASSPTGEGLNDEIRRLELADETYVCDYIDRQPEVYCPGAERTEPGAA